jgi:hypothetical protein
MLYITRLQLEIAELQRQEIDIRQEKEDKEREVADALAPRLASLELAGDVCFTKGISVSFTKHMSVFCTKPNPVILTSSRRFHNPLSRPRAAH